MLGRHFGRIIHVPGTLSANLDIKFSVPVDCRINRISVVASNGSDATIDVGTDAQFDDILDGKDAGDSGTPAVYDIDDWESGEPATLSKGDILGIVVDYDGSSGTAADDLTIDIDFLEG